MATPRKRWFRVADSILREEWSDATLATHVRLMAWLNQRWRRDGIDHSQAGRAVIGSMDAMLITRTQAPRAALRKLSRHPREAGLSTARASLDDDRNPTRVILEWDKFPEFQEMSTRSPGGRRVSSSPQTSPSDSDSDSDSDSVHKESPPPADAGSPGASRAGIRSARSRRTRAPADPEPELPLLSTDAEQPPGPKQSRPPSEAAVALTGELIGMVAACHPSARTPGTPNARLRWEQQVERILRERPAEQIRSAVRWLREENPSRGKYAFVVQSASSLREKLDRILSEMARAARSPPVTASAQRSSGVRRGGDISQGDRELYRSMLEEQRRAGRA